MSEIAADAGLGPARPGRGRAIAIGLAGALLLSGATFYAVFSGMVVVPFVGGHEAPPATEAGHAAPDYRAAPSGPAAFVTLDDLVISLGPGSRSRHLKLALSIEVVPGTEGQVAAVAPRILDVLNTFLRAVDEREFEVPAAMQRLRAQMLRRVQLVAPQGSVRDLLIREFVLN